MITVSNLGMQFGGQWLFHRERADAPHAAAVKGGGKQ